MSSHSEIDNRLLPADSDDSVVVFSRATRAGSHVIISMEGGTGSGKTYSAIKLGRGLVGPDGKLGLMDTETGRGRYYAGLDQGYEYGELTPPFAPERYVLGIKAAERAGIECLIIDSGSHEWEGIGGLIEIADSGKSAKGKALSGLKKWSGPKARHKRFVQTMLSTRMHIIVCLRVREKMIQRKKDDGSDEIVSAGWFPVQEKYFPFEMTVRLFFPENSKGHATLIKCPEDLLGAFPEGFQVSLDTGARIADWVKGGVPIDPEFHELKRDAEEAAEGGSVPLKAFWGRLTKSQRTKIATIGANLRSIAEQADRDAEAVEDSEETEGLPSFAAAVGDDF